MKGFLFIQLNRGNNAQGTEIFILAYIIHFNKDSLTISEGAINDGSIVPGNA